MNQSGILSAFDAYRLWARVYSSETVVSLLDEELVTELTPDLRGLRLLDAGCGTGRRLLGIQARAAVGIDASAEMLAAAPIGIATDERIQLMVGDLRELPVEDQSFDVVWCRLALGHVLDCAVVYTELARVCRAGGTIIVTDFHPAAVAAGHRRTFRDGASVYAIEHYVHDVPSQCEAAAKVGLECREIKEGTIGPAVRHRYTGDDWESRYRRDEGLPLVLALSFRRRAN